MTKLRRDILFFLISCHNFRTRHDIDTKLGLLAELDERNATASKKYDDGTTSAPFPFFLNWDSLHAKLNSQYEAWNYKKKKYKKIKANRKSV